jgi:uncharacterized protein (TIGR00661 family)
MKILYAIQGTGNGHLSRARDVIPALQKKGELDLLVSGIQADVALPYPVKYRFKGLSFIFGKSGGVDLYQTFAKAKSRRFVNEIRSLPVHEYDLILNDFEPVSAWACRLRSKPCIGISHQGAVLSAKAPQPKRVDWMGKMVLLNYAPVTSAYGFHFGAYDANIFTPVIRRQIRELPVSDEGHYTVYLPAYDDERLVETLSQVGGDVQWQVFSKHNKEPRRVGGVSLQPVNNDAFIRSMASCRGILCGAGFETPAEALYLRKKLLVVPMKNQYEQYCNAAALKTMGVPVIKNLKHKHVPTIREWVQRGQPVPVDYPDQTEAIIDRVIAAHAGGDR